MAEGYYRVEFPDGRVDETLEGQFAILENVVAPVFREMLQHRNPIHISLNVYARDAIAGYIAMQHVRTPSFRRPTKAMATLLARAHIDDFLADAERFEQRRKTNVPEDARSREEWLSEFREGRVEGRGARGVVSEGAADCS